MKCRGPSFLNEIKAFPFPPQAHRTALLAGWSLSYIPRWPQDAGMYSTTVLLQNDHHY